MYGGGSQGMMGLISGAVLHEGGSVTAVIPAAMVRAGGEGESSPTGGHIRLEEEGREKVRGLEHYVYISDLRNSDLEGRICEPRIPCFVDRRT